MEYENNVIDQEETKELNNSYEERQQPEVVTDCYDSNNPHTDGTKFGAGEAVVGGLAVGGLAGLIYLIVKFVKWLYAKITGQEPEEVEEEKPKKKVKKAAPKKKVKKAAPKKKVKKAAPKKKVKTEPEEDDDEDDYVDSDDETDEVEEQDD